MSDVRRMTYDLSGAGAAGIDTLTFARLRELNDRGWQRTDFGVLALVDSGHGTVSVDFVTSALEPCAAVWIAPGSVHRWVDIDGLDGVVVLFLAEAAITNPASSAAWGHDRGTVRRLEPDAWRYVEAAVAHLCLELAAVDQRPAEVPNLLLSVLLDRVAPGLAGDHAPASLTHAFSRAVEMHFRDHHDVGFYADLLGYSSRTVTRAVQHDSGVTAKRVIVDRIVLEAKRLLAHDRCTAVACAGRLGFPDAASFSIFFRTYVGVRPGAWQARQDETARDVVTAPGSRAGRGSRPPGG